MLGTAINAVSTQDALAVLHHTCPHHGVYFQAHGTVLGTVLAVNAHGRIGPKAQGRPLEDVADLPSEDHKGGYPIAVMAAGPSAAHSGQGNENRNHRIIEEIGLGAIHRYSTIFAISRESSFWLE